MLYTVIQFKTPAATPDLAGLDCPLLEAVAPYHLPNDRDYTMVDPQLPAKKEIESRRLALRLKAPNLDMRNVEFRRMCAEAADKVLLESWTLPRRQGWGRDAERAYYKRERLY